MLIASERVNEFPKDLTASMRHSFTNPPSVNGLECFAIRCEMAYDAAVAFAEHVALLSESKVLSQLSLYTLILIPLLN